MSIKTQHSQRLEAFTLIEMLVVVAIIALLAAILFPVFSRTRESARRTSCQSNMKQIGLGVMQYVQDYDETLPGDGAATYGTAPPYAKPRGWLQMIYPYTRSIAIYQCPSEPHAGDPDGEEFVGFKATSSSTPSIVSFGDYQFNDVVTGIRIPKITNASFTILGTEGIAGNASHSQAGCGIFKPCGSSANLGALAKIYTDVGATGASEEARHFGGLNVVFCDGHIKWYKLRPGPFVQVYNANYSYQGFQAENIYNGCTSIAASTTAPVHSGDNPTFSITP